MTVSTLTNKVTYTGNGATTAFAVPFKVLDVDHLVVKRRVAATGATDYTYVGTDYSYSGIGNDSGTLTLSGTALSSTYELVIERIVPYTQGLDIVNAGGFYPDSVEEQLDLTTMQVQQIAEQADDTEARALRVPEGETVGLLPTLNSLIGKYLAFDAEGSPVGASGTGSDSGLRTDLADTTGALLIGYVRAVTGAVARSASSIFTERTPTPLDFLSIIEAAKVYAGTVSTEDHGPAIQKANDIGRGVDYPGTLYSVRTPVTGVKGTHKGAGQFRTEIRALAAMDQLFKVEEARGSISDLFFNGNYLADLVIHVANANGFTLRLNRIEKGVKDGVYAEATGNNNSMSIYNNIIRYHGGGFVAGTSYSTGTASVTATSDTITITGAVDLTTLGLRPYLTDIFLDGDKPRTVVEVTATTIKVSRPIATTFTAVAYELWDGSCVALSQYGDNGISDFGNNTFQNLGKGFAIKVHSLYGPKIRGNTYEDLWSGVSWGVAGSSAGAVQVIGGSDTDGYYEALDYEHRVESVRNLKLQANQHSLGFGAIDIVDVNYITGLSFETRGAQLRGPIVSLVNVVGSANLEHGKSYVVAQSSGSGNFDLNLPPIVATPTIQRVLTYMPLKIPIYVTTLGGKTATVKSSDLTINSVAGATGIPHTADNKELMAVFLNPGATAPRWLLTVSG